MLHRDGARGLHHVEGAHDIGVDIGARVFQAIPNPCLRREMNNYIGRSLRDGHLQGFIVFQHRLGEREFRMLAQYLDPALLETDILIIGHSVIAGDRPALLK